MSGGPRMTGKIGAQAGLALLLVPRKHPYRLEAEVAAGVGLAALIALLLRPAEATET